MTDESYASSARRHFRRHAEMIERAGDAVGGNDTELANDLWAMAARVRAYADSFTLQEGS